MHYKFGDIVKYTGKTKLYNNGSGIRKGAIGVVLHHHRVNEIHEKLTDDDFAVQLVLKADIGNDSYLQAKELELVV